MRGYHGREDLTAETFDDGWFRTGDIGQLDGDGFLKITGRKKEIIVTAGGKNVVPALLEDQIRADALVSQVLVVGDNHAVVKAAVQELISKANQSVSQAEAIKAFRIVASDFTEASGHLTPSLKVKRAQVMKDFDAVIEEMYSAPRAG